MKSIRFILLYFLITTNVINLKGQDDIKYDYYTTKDGLSQNTVYSIIQDTFGFMWFGTQEGLNRFDGRTFKVFKENSKIKSNLKGDFIYSLFIDKEGNLWAGTDKALNKYNYQTETFTPYITNGRKISCIKQDKRGGIWIGSDNGMLYFNQKDNSIKKLNSFKEVEVKSIAITGDSLWIGSDHGLYVQDLKNLNNSEKLVPDYNNHMDLNINAIYVNKKGDAVWIGTQNGNVYKSSIPFLIFNLDRHYYAAVTSFSEDKNGTIHIGHQKSHEKIIQSKNLTDQNVLSLFNDRDDNLWIGTYIGGVNKFTKDKVKFSLNKFFFEENQYDNFIWSIFEIDLDKVLLGSHSGNLYLFSPSNKKFILIKHLSSAIISICKDRNGTIWLGTNKGTIYIYKNNKLTKSDLFQQNKAIRIIKLDKTNPWLWIGTAGNGVYIFDYTKEKIICNYTTLDGLSSNDIYSIQYDDYDINTVWIGTIGFGINKLYFKYSNINKPLIVKSLNNYSIIAMYQDLYNKNNLWLGTQDGLLKFDKTHFKNVPFGSDPVFPDESFCGILADKEGFLWISTSKGKIIKFNTKNEKIICLFDWNDGIQEGEFNGNSYYKTSSGTFFFGASNGFYIFSPENINLTRKIPQIYFTKLFINEKEINTEDKIDNFILSNSISYSPKIKLKYNRTILIRIDFSAIDYFVPKRINYWAELVHGGDTIKYDLNNKTSISLSNLRWGEYKLNVWSGNSYFSNRNHRENLKTFLIEITPPWYASTLFYIITTLIIVILLYAIIYITKKSSKRKIEIRIENERKINLIKRLNNKNEVLERLNRIDDFNEIAEEFMKSSVKIFGFDYVIISVVDYFKNRISSDFNYSKDRNLINPDFWKKESNYDINDNDILCNVVKRKVFRQILGESKDIVAFEDINRNIFNKYKHNELNRIFIPIFHRAQNSLKNFLNDDEDVVIGVVEAGIHTINKNNIPEELISEYKYFINSCEQKFYRAYKILEKNTIDELVDNHLNIDDENDFLKLILSDTITHMGIDIGEIYFINFDDNNESLIISLNNNNYKTHEERKSFSKMKKLDPIGIPWYAIATKYIYFSNNVLNDKYYIKEYDESKSQLAVPLIYMDKVLGAISMISYKENYFNVIKAAIIQEILDKAIPLFIEKKLDNKLRSLIVPFDKFNEITGIYRTIRLTIEDYFSSENISIWGQDSFKTEFIENGKTILSYRLCESSDKLMKEFNNNNFKVIQSDLVNKGSKITPIIVDCIDKKFFEFDFQEFYNKIGMSSIIIIPIVVDVRSLGFITIASKNYITSLLPEDRVFLTQISIKAGLALQYAKLFNSFKVIGESLTVNDQKETLQRITDNAREVLNADFVLLFKYDADSQRFAHDITFSGTLYHEILIDGIITKGLEDTYLVDHIIDHSSVYLENEQEYFNFSESRGCFQSSIFRESFWYREKNKSMAAIKLEFENKPVGIMFFNYRSGQVFSEEFKSLVNSFASLASSSIISANHIEKIKTQAKQMQEFYFEIFNELPIGLYRIKTDNNNDEIIHCNETFAHMLGYSIKELIGADIRKFYESEDEFVNFLQELSDKAKNDLPLIEYEITLKTKSGDIKTFEWYGKGIFDKEGNLIGRIGAEIDISEKKELGKKVKELSEQIGQVLHQYTSTIIHVQTTCTGIMQSILPELMDRNENLQLEKTNESLLNIVKTVIKLTERLFMIINEKKIENISNFEIANSGFNICLNVLYDYIIDQSETTGIRNSASKLIYIAASIPSYILPKQEIKQFNNYCKELINLSIGMQLHEIKEDVIEINNSVVTLRERIIKNIEGNSKKSTFLLSKPINQALSELIEFANIKKIQIIKQLCDNEIYIDGYERELVNSFRTIIHNAIKYSWKLSSKESKIVIKLIKEFNTAIFTISNLGIPITKEEITKNLIFILGYRGIYSQEGQRPGTGVGLTEAKQVIEKHNGKIVVSSEPLPGNDPENYSKPFITTIKVVLPINN